jgi:hypothetical protein
MTTIALLVTGKTEFVALAESLRQVFPADFSYVNDHVADPESRLRGFTSRDCTGYVGAPWSEESDLSWFVAHLVGAAFPGRHGDPPDLVVGVDDVELLNAGHPEVVVQVLQDAVRAHVERNWTGTARERVYERLQDHCSFHLLKPMVEAYFFGEPAALERAGQISSRTSRFDPEKRDPEDFLVDDPDYLGTPEPPKTARKSARAKRDWRLGTAKRPQHPKKYVQFLCDELGDGNTRYREVTGGKAALERLAWGEVLRRPEHASFARALLADIARTVPPRPQYSEMLAKDPVCATWPPPRHRVLRNI